MNESVFTAAAIVIESFLAAFIVWGIFHEPQLKAWERRTWARIRARRRARRLRKATDTLCRDGYIVVYHDAPRPERDSSVTGVVERWYRDHSDFGFRNSALIEPAFRSVGDCDGNKK